MRIVDAIFEKCPDLNIDCRRPGPGAAASSQCRRMTPVGPEPPRVIQINNIVD